MEKLINLINGASLNSQTEAILEGRVTINTFEKAVQQYSAMSRLDRQHYFLNLVERMRKVNRPDKALACLFLIEKIAKIDEEVDIPPVDCLVFTENSKEAIAITNLVKYYYYVLKNNEHNRRNIYGLNCEEVLSEELLFSQHAVDNILEFIKIDFIFAYCLTSIPKRQNLLRIVCFSIINQLRQDLAKTIAFINGKLKLILQDDSASFHINLVYEKLVLIMKNKNKMSSAAKLVGLNQEMPVYQVDPDFNRAIELKLNEKRCERKLFDQQRQRRMSRGSLREADFSSIDAGDIMMQSAESFLLIGQEQC